MNIGILGAGTWGTALARMLSLDGNNVTVWSAIEKEIETLSKKRSHPNLMGMKIPADIVFTSSLEETCKDKEIIVFAVPSVYVRSVAASAKEYVSKTSVIVDVAKGIEKGSLKTMTEIIEDEMGEGYRFVALSGPTHAEEVARDLPTTIVSASKDKAAAELVQKVFSNSVMRVYTNSDIRGVEVCGALKNIIALAAGISAGLGYGDNAKAAIITRGAAEMARLGVAMNCDVKTFYGLAGVGDLIVTCTSIHSRNNHAGFLIGKGHSPERAIEEVGMVVEGMNALPSAIELSKKYGVEMPIIFAVNDIVNNKANPIEAVEALMTREYKNEAEKNG